MSGSSKVPQPPGLSPQERELINQQKFSLEQFSKLLSEESLKATETQNILRGLSGLYKTTTVPGKPEDIIDQKKIDDTISQLNQQIATARSLRAPFANQLEAHKAEVESARKNYELAKKLGFVDPNAIPKDRTETELDTDAVAKLRQRVQENIDYQNQLAERDKLIEEKAGSILDQLLNRQQLALEGKLAIDPAITEAKKREFSGVAENLRRRGYDVIGDDPDTAVAIGTPAVQTLDTFKKRYNLIEDASRRGELDAATTRNLGQFGLVQELRGSSSANPALTSLNFAMGAGDVGPARFMGAYPALTSGYGALQAPYANQRHMQYGADVQNAALSSQRQGGLLNLASTLATTGLLMKAPWLAGVGGGFGLMGLTSTKTAKKNIHRLTKREENKIFNLVKKGDVYTFDYKDPRHGEGKRIGIIAEEAPAELVTPDRKAQDVGNTLNVLLTSIRALDRKIDRKFRLTRRAA